MPTTPMTPCPRCWGGKVEADGSPATGYEPCRKCGGLGLVEDRLLTPNFWEHEVWGKARHRSDGSLVSNEMTSEQTERMRRHLFECVEPLRDDVGCGLRITSGYRSQEWDALVAGAEWRTKFSGHSWATATDLQPISATLTIAHLMRSVAKRAKACPFDQAILEGECLHLSAAAPRIGWLQRGHLFVRVHKDGGFGYKPWNDTAEQSKMIM